MTTTVRRTEHHQRPGPHREARVRPHEARPRWPTRLGTPLRERSDSPADGAQFPCQEYDADLWFAERPADVEFAKSLCGTCPVVAECLAGALDRREPWGVWGGQLFVQGVVVPRKRPRGRPRKSESAAA